MNATSPLIVNLEIAVVVCACALWEVVPQI